MKTEEMKPIDPSLERLIAGIEADKLPAVFSAQVQLLEKANLEYKKAEQKEKTVRKKVEKVLEEADQLIEEARSVGGHTGKKSSFLWFEWTSKAEEIRALKENLREIIEHGENSAEAQKKLAEVQAALLESQTALLQVQKAHMEYQRQIASATKFVFGLSAYNMAASQSVLIQLRAILAGESEETLGELAQQQLMLALDQIKNQECIITRLNETETQIEDLSAEIERKQAEIAAIGEVDEAQSRMISENARTLQAHEETLAAQQRKDDEFSRMFAEQDREDKTQDEKIAANVNKLEALAQRCAKLEDQLAQMQVEAQETVDKLCGLMAAQKEELLQKNEELEQKISILQEKAQRKTWKIIVSVLAGAALLLNLLQILGVL